MKPEQKSLRLLGVTRSKAKMIEYHVPEHYQEIDLTTDPAKLLVISIGLLGDLAADINDEKMRISELKSRQKLLLFSAYFFDSYLQSNLNNNISIYMKLFGAASYYLCDLPGSALVLANKISYEKAALDFDFLDCVLLWLLKSNYNSPVMMRVSAFEIYAISICERFKEFITTGHNELELIELSNLLREAVYNFGTPHQLLLADVIGAVLRKKIQNSCWISLPQYSELPRDAWLSVLQKDSFIKEIWPAQRLLGEAGVLKGKSAVIQMPTSAGKTKATEIIIRSAFLSGRATLAVIVAPFRALCHEIKTELTLAFNNEPTNIDELSEVLQSDFQSMDLISRQQIIVATPEKLLYTIRHSPHIVTSIGLVIFDEGHQFDNGTRGVTYELLLSSLRSILHSNVQKILISAVLSNAESIGLWLNNTATVVNGANLLPTYRSIGFVSWLDNLGKIEYVNNDDIEKNEFFVPRVIERITLKDFTLSKKTISFPEKSDGQSIALFLGIKLSLNGCVAIFCGRKSAATNICKQAVSLIESGVDLVLPDSYSNKAEVERLFNLQALNLGIISSATLSAKHGIFVHHGNIPFGIRLAVEHAARENYIRFIVCTSTLAQGVNLPIRYLLVTSIYQGGSEIKVRDFHNLIGRAGRAGKHTEGSILFVDPEIYDKRMIGKGRWRWGKIKALLKPKNSEPCISNLLSIFEPFKSDDGKSITEMSALDFVNAYIEGPHVVSNLVHIIARNNRDKGFSVKGINDQITLKIGLIASIESFLLSHWVDELDVGFEQNIKKLAEGTLAYFLADDQKRDLIIMLFVLLAKNIKNKIYDPATRRIYSRTLYGVKDIQEIEVWLEENLNELLFSASDSELLDALWFLLASLMKNQLCNKFDKPEVLRILAHQWIAGASFNDIFLLNHKLKSKKIWGKQRRNFSIEDIVDICEGGFGYHGSLVLGALAEFVMLLNNGVFVKLVGKLQLLQKKIKYGLPTQVAIVLYELGFSDRVVAMDLASSLNIFSGNSESVIEALKYNRAIVIKTINKYPSYFHMIMNNIIQ